MCTRKWDMPVRPGTSARPPTWYHAQGETTGAWRASSACITSPLSRRREAGASVTAGMQRSLANHAREPLAYERGSTWWNARLVWSDVGAREGRALRLGFSLYRRRGTPLRVLEGVAGMLVLARRRLPLRQLAGDRVRSPRRHHSADRRSVLLHSLRRLGGPAWLPPGLWQDSGDNESTAGLRGDRLECWRGRLGPDRAPLLDHVDLWRRFAWRSCQLGDRQERDR